jgi:hypothetical protein
MRLHGRAENSGSGAIFRYGADCLPPSAAEQRHAVYVVSTMAAAIPHDANR